jgi:hypothetical protein
MHSSQLGVIVYPPQGGTEKSNLLLRVLTCRGELQLSGPGRQALKNAGSLFLSVFRRFVLRDGFFKIRLSCWSIHYWAVLSIVSVM